MLQIPIQAVPSQQISCVVAGQNCRIGIYLLNDDIFFDLNSNGVDICLASIARNVVPLDPRNSYDGFQGNFFFIDTQGLDDPEFTGFGTRWFLVYLTPADLVLLETQPAAVIISTPILTLSETLVETSSAPGNYSIAHGLPEIPFMIELINLNDTGNTWAQATFADATNINLVASDVGVKVKILIYTVAASGLTTQSPAATLLVTSSAGGNFSWPHGLGAVPSLIEIVPTSGGLIGGQNPVLFDATNIYLTASDIGDTATVYVYAPISGPALNIQGPVLTLTVTSSAGGNFSIPHNLNSTPSRISILMISDGNIWGQTPDVDGTNINLVASDTGKVAKIFVFA